MVCNWHIYGFVAIYQNANKVAMYLSSDSRLHERVQFFSAMLKNIQFGKACFDLIAYIFPV